MISAVYSLFVGSFIGGSVCDEALKIRRRSGTIVSRTIGWLGLNKRDMSVWLEGRNWKTEEEVTSTTL